VRDPIPFPTTDRIERENASAPEHASDLSPDLVESVPLAAERSESPSRDQITAIVRSLEQEATYDDILRELAFERMVRRGLDDLAAGRMFTTDQLNQKVRSWHR